MPPEQIYVSNHACALYTFAVCTYSSFVIYVSVCVCVGMHTWVCVCEIKTISCVLYYYWESVKHCAYNNGTKLKWTCFQKTGNIRVPFRWNIRNLQMWGIQFVKKWHFEKGLYYLPQSGQISDNGIFNNGRSWFLSGRNWPGGNGSPALDHLDLTISSCKSYNALLHYEHSTVVQRL